MTLSQYPKLESPNLNLISPVLAENCKMGI